MLEAWAELNSIAHCLLVHTKAAASRQAWLGLTTVPAHKCQSKWQVMSCWAAAPTNEMQETQIWGQTL